MELIDLPYWLGFSYIPHIGPVRFKQLESHFGSMEKAWNAGADKLEQAGLDKTSIQTIITSRPKINPGAKMEYMNRLGVRLITWHDSLYPDRLKEIHDYPAMLFIRGTITKEDNWALAIVGSRQPTIYGKQVSEEMAAELTRNGITIVSGMARGIDTIAHKAVLSAEGRTLAVLGGGIDCIYPPENNSLARQISMHGGVISEYPPGIHPRPEYFPQRNRIISGLCMGVLVIEAGETSGALITAHLALEQNREVFAIPGSILSTASTGSNKLIQEGAKLVQKVSDILEEFNLNIIINQDKAEAKNISPANETETILLEHLCIEPKHIDEICQQSNLPIHTVSSTLAMMEIKGMVKQIGTMNYVLIRDVDKGYTVTID